MTNSCRRDFVVIKIKNININIGKKSGNHPTLYATKDTFEWFGKNCFRGLVVKYNEFLVVWLLYLYMIKEHRIQERIYTTQR